jgi:hypothetical protein
LPEKWQDSRGFKDKDGCSEGETSGQESTMTTVASDSRKVANGRLVPLRRPSNANPPVEKQTPDKTAAPWPVAYAWALGLAISAVLWGALAVAIHYFW